MTERAEIVAWLRGRADSRRYWGGTFWLRCRAARIAFLRPHGLVSVAIDQIAAAIERGEHMETHHAE